MPILPREEYCHVLLPVEDAGGEAGGDEAVEPSAGPHHRAAVKAEEGQGAGNNLEQDKN